MGTYYITISFKKCRTWDNEKVRTLGGSYASALKYIYGERFIDVDLEENCKAYLQRQKERKITIFNSELI